MLGVILFCINRGYEPFLFSPGALLLIAIPLQLLAMAFVAAGLKEILRRQTEAFSILLTYSTSCYAAVGWLYMLWLHVTGGPGLPGESASIQVKRQAILNRYQQLREELSD
ncbi:MAG: hypothetical protein GKR94_13110 [Gammaproteobacteria bacterium]|nr:hypothetical protein [Gammaproteobacteria bacterium]